MKIICYLLLMVGLSYSQAWAAGKRIALVIGNSQYQSLGYLSNPVNDATAIADKLTALGFELIAINGQANQQAILNLTENNFLLAIENFSNKARGAEIAMIYYAGHGVQFAQDTYLLPVDIPKDSLNLFKRHAIRLESILQVLDGKAELTVAVFDACREIPELDSEIFSATRSSGLSGGLNRGLGRVQSQGGRSRVIAFSGAAGQLVKDGVGDNSPYTKQLLSQLDKPEFEVVDMFRQVAYNFSQKQGGQLPEVVIQGVPPQKYYLNVRKQGRSKKTLVSDNLSSTFELSFWNRIKTSKQIKDYQQYLNKFPNGLFVELSRQKIKALTPVIQLNREEVRPRPNPLTNNDSRSKNYLEYFNKGKRFLYEKARPDKAINFFNKALQYKQADASLLFEMGMAYMELDNYPEAIVRFNKAIKLRANYLKAYQQIAKSYQAIGDEVNADYFYKLSNQ